MVSSTDSPNAIPKTRMVEGFKGTPKYPISPAVNSSGSKFGMSETKTILNERNIKPTRKQVNKKAKTKDDIKLSSR